MYCSSAVSIFAYFRVIESSGAILQPRGIILVPRGAILEPRGVILEPRGVMLEGGGRLGTTPARTSESQIYFA